MDSNIIITNNSAGSVHINIEGIIGVPETQQELDRNVSTTYESFRQILERIAEIDSSEIVVDIRSTGGNVNDALLIHDAIVATGAVVTTRCFGYVASAATIIAQAASQGLRQISSNALYLIHNSAMEAEGNAQKLTQTADLLGKTDQTIATIYANRSGREVDEFVALMAENNGDGRWLTPQEAMEFGLVDSIFEKAESIDGVSNTSDGMIASLWNRLVSALGVGTSKSDEVEEREQEDEQEQSQQNHDGGVTDVEEGSCDDSKVEAQGDGQEVEAQAVVQGEVLNVAENGVAVFLTERAMQVRAAAKASKTMSVEDPSVDESTQAIQSNSSAYYEDAKNF